MQRIFSQRGLVVNKQVYVIMHMAYFIHTVNVAFKHIAKQLLNRLIYGLVKTVRINLHWLMFLHFSQIGHYSDKLRDA